MATVTTRTARDAVLQYDRRFDRGFVHTVSSTHRIPCHRRVREDGNLAGYRWGWERKKGILALTRERQED